MSKSNDEIKMKLSPISLAERSKVRVFCQSHSGIAGSNPAGGLDISVVKVLCCYVEVSAMG